MIRIDIMKKIISFLLSLVLVGTTCLASEPADVEFGFEVEKIEHYDDPTLPLNITVTIPQTFEGGTVLVTFYNNNSVSKVIPLDATAKTESIPFPVRYKDGDGLPLTPDRVRLFLWNKGSLKPLAYSKDVLTSSVIETANYYTYNYILKYFVNRGNTKGIPDLMLASLDEPSKYPNVYSALQSLKECAQIANNNKLTTLLTNESTKRLLGEKLDSLVSDLEIIDNDKEQENELIRLRSAAKLTNKQNTAVDYLASFFNITLPK